MKGKCKAIKHISRVKFIKIFYWTPCKFFYFDSLEPVSSVRALILPLFFSSRLSSDLTTEQHIASKVADTRKSVCLGFMSAYNCDQLQPDTSKNENWIFWIGFIT